MVPPKQNCYPFERPGYNCTKCDEVPEVTGSPAHTVTHPIAGWGAGARSQTELSVPGLRTVFRVGQSAGIIIGLTTAGSFDQTDPATIRHGLYLWASPGYLFGQVFESGAPAHTMFERQLDDTFEIRRIGDQVRYLVNGAVRYVSGVPSTGPAIVGCCLYLTGDVVL